MPCSHTLLLHGVVLKSPPLYSTKSLNDLCHLRKFQASIHGSVHKMSLPQDVPSTHLSKVGLPLHTSRYLWYWIVVANWLDNICQKLCRGCDVDCEGHCQVTSNGSETGRKKKKKGFVDVWCFINIAISAKLSEFWTLRKGLQARAWPPNIFAIKIDGVGPVDNRPSTD